MELNSGEAGAFICVRHSVDQASSTQISTAGRSLICNISLSDLSVATLHSSRYVSCQLVGWTAPKLLNAHLALGTACMLLDKARQLASNFPNRNPSRSLLYVIGPEPIMPVSGVSHMTGPPRLIDRRGGVTRGCIHPFLPNYLQLRALLHWTRSTGTENSYCLTRV